MTHRVAVASTGPLRSLIHQMLEGEDLVCDSISFANWTNVGMCHAEIAILDLASGGALEVHTGLKHLRASLDFRGALLVVSFLPIEITLKDEGGEAISTPGCFYIQLPCLIEWIREVLLHWVVLSDDEMAQARKILTARDIAHAASARKHDYENRLALAFAHLREVEKLSYFSIPDPGRLSKELYSINLHLTREKIYNLRTDLTALLKQADTWKGNNHPSSSYPLDKQWSAVESWLELSDRWHDQAHLDFNEVFKQAKQLHTALKEILAVITDLKVEAQEVIADGK
jgi:hypothetical protein